MRRTTRSPDSSVAILREVGEVPAKLLNFPVCWNITVASSEDFIVQIAAHRLSRLKIIAEPVTFGVGDFADPAVLQPG